MAAAAANKFMKSGSQGCIVYPKLKEEGNTAVYNTPNNKISKVFYEKSTYDLEKQSIQNAYSASNRRGTINIGNSFNVGNLNQEIKTEMNSDPNRTACRKVMTKLREGERIYIFNQKKIINDLRELQKPPAQKKDVSFFINAYIALKKINAKRIVHMDMASRNIFYDATEAVIGDFGYAVNFSLKHEIWVKQLDTFIESHVKKDLTWMEMFTQDQLTPEAYLAVFLYYNYDNIIDICQEIKDTTLEELIDYFDATMFKETGLIKIGAKYYTEFRKLILWVLNVWTKIDKSVEDKKQDFESKMIEYLVKSDKKNFVRAILTIVNLSEEQKVTLMQEIWVNEKFDYFDSLVHAGASIPAAAAAPAADAAGESIPAAAAAAGVPLNFPLPPLGFSVAAAAGESIPAAAAAGAPAPNIPNVSPENLELQSEINEKLEELGASENERNAVLTIKDKSDAVRLLSSDSILKHSLRTSIIDQKQFDALSSIHQRKKQANAELMRLMSSFGKKKGAGKTRRQRQNKRKTRRNRH